MIIGTVQSVATADGAQFEAVAKLDERRHLLSIAIRIVSVGQSERPAVEPVAMYDVTSGLAGSVRLRSEAAAGEAATVVDAFLAEEAVVDEQTTCTAVRVPDSQSYLCIRVTREVCSL